MATHIVVVENIKDWLPEYPQEMSVVTVKEYLLRAEHIKIKGENVINLCRSYRYLSTGYYCSLLAEARRHKVIPPIRTITDLSSRSIYSLNVEDLDKKVDASLKKLHYKQETDRFEFFLAFGQGDFPGLQDIGRQIFDLFRCPLLKVEFRFQHKWSINSIKSVPLNSLTSGQSALFVKSMSEYLSKRWRSPKVKSIYRYDLAVLHNPNEKLPPSNMPALNRFIKVGKKLGVNVELIEKKDYGRLAEYDALFIRETTGIDHYTYLFAKKAESEGMVVIDDPDSITRCTNKVFLAELLQTHNIPTPNTIVLQKGEHGWLKKIKGYPLVLKIPDGSFSRGVLKADGEAQAKEISAQLFKESDLILAQEFLYTQFDWRIGILNRKPLYASQYFMSRDHWQIVKHEASGKTIQGSAKSWVVEDVLPQVVNVALEAANLIGDGLYGVDIKQNADEVFVIEVNDNPNIDTGVEDLILGDKLYASVINEFVRRLDQRKGR